MKYLAAYALLTLGGKTDISNPYLIQKPQTLSLSSETSDLRSQTKKSTESSAASRERSWTNWSLTELRRSVVLLPPLLLLVPPRPRLPKSSKRRRKNQRSRPLLPPRKKKLTKIWVDSLTDVIDLFKIHLHIIHKHNSIYRFINPTFFIF